MAGVKTSILGAPLNESQPNMPLEVWAGGQDLVTLQKERVIIIKPSDKTGGINILPFDAYVKVMGDKLTQTYVAPDGTTKPKYVKVTKKDLKLQHQRIEKLVEKGVDKGFICPEDAALMVPPEPAAGRLYGLVKDHKPVNPETGIPPLREVISGSGSNTEMVSAYADHHIKSYVKKLETYLEDTPHVLRCVALMNREGPLPPGAIPVTCDARELYPSIPHEGGLDAVEESVEEDTTLQPGHGEFIVECMDATLTCNTFE